MARLHYHLNFVAVATRGNPKDRVRRFAGGGEERKRQTEEGEAEKDP